jgi:hypothetical protein
LCRSVKLPSDEISVGGTSAYAYYYRTVLKSFNLLKSLTYPVGTIIGRRYRNFQDQGHVAILVYNSKRNMNTLLQSFAPKGVNDDYAVAESHAGHYYEYVILPQDWFIQRCTRKPTITLDQVLEYGKSSRGIPYGMWDGNEKLSDYAPMWTCSANNLREMTATNVHVNTNHNLTSKL